MLIIKPSSANLEVWTVFNLTFSIFITCLDSTSFKTLYF